MRSSFVLGVVFAVVLASACSSSSSTTSSGGPGDAATSSSGGSSGGGSSGTASSSGDPEECPPPPDGTQSATFIACTDPDAGTCNPLDLESKALTFCSTTTFDIGWVPPNITSEICGAPSGASIVRIADGLCGLAAVVVPTDLPAGTNAVEAKARTGYVVRTKEGNRFIVWVMSMSDGLSIQWIAAAPSM